MGFSEFFLLHIFSICCWLICCCCCGVASGEYSEGNEPDQLFALRGRVFPGDERYIVVVRCELCEIPILSDYTVKKSGQFAFKFGLKYNKKDYTKIKLKIEISTRFKRGNQYRKNEWEIQNLNLEKEYHFHMGHWKENGIYLSAKFKNVFVTRLQRNFQFALLVYGKSGAHPFGKKTGIDQLDWASEPLIEMRFAEHEIEEPFRIPFDTTAAYDYIKAHKYPEIKIDLVQLPEKNCFCGQGFIGRQPKIIKACGHAFHKECLDKRVREFQQITTTGEQKEISLPCSWCAEEGTLYGGSVKGKIGLCEGIVGSLRRCTNSSGEYKMTAGWDGLTRISKELWSAKITMPVFQIGDEPEFTYKFVVNEKKQMGRNAFNEMAMAEVRLEKSEWSLLEDDDQQDGGDVAKSGIQNSIGQKDKNLAEENKEEDVLEASFGRTSSIDQKEKNLTNKNRSKGKIEDFYEIDGDELKRRSTKQEYSEQPAIISDEKEFEINNKQHEYYSQWSCEFFDALRRQLDCDREKDDLKEQPAEYLQQINNNAFDGGSREEQKFQRKQSFSLDKSDDEFPRRAHISRNKGSSSRAGGRVNSHIQASMPANDDGFTDYEKEMQDRKFNEFLWQQRNKFIRNSNASRNWNNDDEEDDYDYYSQDEDLDADEKGESAFFRRNSQINNRGKSTTNFHRYHPRV